MSRDEIIQAAYSAYIEYYGQDPAATPIFTDLHEELVFKKAFTAVVDSVLENSRGFKDPSDNYGDLYIGN